MPKENTKPRRPKGEGQISLLPSGKALARADFGFGRKSKTCVNKTAASAWIKAQEELAKEAKKAAEEEARRQQSPMLYTYLKEYIKRYKSVQIAPKTQEMYNAAYNSITGEKKARKKKGDTTPPPTYPKLQNKPMAEITGEEIQDFVNELSETLSRSSINKIMMLLSQAYKQCIADDKLIKNPTAAVKLPKKIAKKVIALTKEEQERVEVAAIEYDNGDFIIFLLYTGLRLEEALSLTWQDVDLETAECIVKSSKTESGLRTIYLSNMALAVLENRQQKHKKSKPKDAVFLNNNGVPLANNIYRLCQKIGQKADVEHFHPHMCRHCFATRLLEKGASMKAVSELLGHKSIQITFDTYSHVLSGLKKDTINLLN